MTKRAPKRQPRQVPKRLRRQDVIAAVRAWQTSRQMHPLTCGYNSRHRPLEPKAEGPMSVVLVCPDCEYVQTEIPPIVLTAGPLLGRQAHGLDNPEVPSSPDDLKKPAVRLLKSKPQARRSQARKAR